MIAKGKVVYISGADGTNAEISLCDNTDNTKEFHVGMLIANIANGATGQVRIIGQVDDVNTAGFNDGDILYLSTAGDLVNAKPVAGVVKPLGYCIFADAAGSVVLFDIDNGYISVIGQDLDIKMGDAAGTFGVIFEDSGDVAVAKIDSNGVAYFDVINEFTTNAGVTIEGVLLENGEIFLDAQKAIVFDGATGNNYVYMDVSGQMEVLSDSNILLTTGGTVVVTGNLSLFDEKLLNIGSNDDLTIQYQDGTDVAFMDFAGAGGLWIRDSSSWNVYIGVDSATGYIELYPRVSVTTGGAVAPLAMIHVDQGVNDAEIPVLLLDQADESEGFINFIGSDRGVISGPTNSVVSVRVELDGTVYRLALYADA